MSDTIDEYGASMLFLRHALHDRDKRIAELEARLAEYEATATLDPVVECPSCGLEIRLAEEGEGQ